MQPLDQYMLARTAEVIREVLPWYEAFEFHRIYQRLNQFCVVDLSAIYFDVTKDRLYTFAPASPSRRSAQTALWRIGEALVRLVAPIMSFTADEVWRYLPDTGSREASVHLAQFPKPEATADSLQEQLRSDWDTLFAIRPEVLKPLEDARREKLIGSNLEAQVLLSAAEPLHSVLKRNQPDLPALFVVSQVRLEQASGNGASPLSVEVSRAAGEKCERCWNYSIHVGENSAYPSVCERCSSALAEIEAAGDDR
jgi:isoleucyl-tRNA synthetase